MNTSDVLSVEQIKARILEYVCTVPGCSALQILQKATISGDNFALDLPRLLDSLVETGKLARVEAASLDCTREEHFFYPATSDLMISVQPDNRISIKGNLNGMTYFKLLSAGTKVSIVKN